MGPIAWVLFRLFAHTLKMCRETAPLITLTHPLIFPTSVWGDIRVGKAFFPDTSKITSPGAHTVWKRKPGRPGPEDLRTISEIRGNFD